MKIIKFILLMSIALAPVVADDVTLGDVSARLDDLERKVAGERTFDTQTEALEKALQQIEKLNIQVQDLQQQINASKTASPSINNVHTSPDPIAQNDFSIPASEGDETESILDMLQQSFPNEKTKEELVVKRDKATSTAQAKANTVLPEGNETAQFNQAKALYEAKSFPEAEKSFTYFLEKNPKASFRAQAYYYLGRTEFAQKKFNGAQKSFAASYKADSKSIQALEALFYLGKALKADKQDKKACIAWNKVNQESSRLSAGMKKDLQEVLKDCKG